MSNTSDTKLKPCPFCGSRLTTMTMLEGSRWIMCTACKGEGPWASSDEDAIEAWNRRSPVEVGVTIKGVEWTYDGGTWEAFSEVGTYTVYLRVAGDWLLLLNGGGRKAYPTEDEAKAGAQLDFEQRIRSALLPSTDTEARIKGTISEDVERSIKMAEAYAMSNSDNYLIEYLDDIRAAIEAAARPEARIGELEGALKAPCA